MTDASVAPQVEAQADASSERLAALLGELAFSELPSRDGTACIEIGRDALIAVLTKLRDQRDFESMTMITGVDRFPATPRFEVVHQLRSLIRNTRIRIKVRLAQDDARLASCVHLFPGANYMERECFDMFGIVFEGHPELKRLLMPEEYGHHPLRKDFPHQGIEPDRLYREWDAKRRADGAVE